MRIVVIGAGYVGLVSGTCFAELGHHVVCIDKDPQKIDLLTQGKIPIYEPGLDALVLTNVAEKRLSFSTELQLDGADAVFIAVGTPTNELDGSADLGYVYAAAQEVAAHITHSAVIVIKSTVPVGTSDEVRRIFAKTNPGVTCDVVSNPEFLREGSAVKDFLWPDRIVIGTPSDHAHQVMQQLYSKLVDQGVALVRMHDNASAELSKYAANTYLAMRVAFVNEIADMCEKLGADIRDVTHGMGMDSRIGPHYLHPGPGFGGSCFPKDTKALLKMAQDTGSSGEIVRAVITANEACKSRMAEKIVQHMGGVKGKTIAILGLTFKENTNDMRDSSSLVIVPALAAQGATLRLFDPEGMAEAKKHFDDKHLVWCEDAYSAVEGADAIVILTAWSLFKTLDLSRVATLVKQKLLIDLRAMFSAQEIEKAGLRYEAVGKK